MAVAMPRHGRLGSLGRGAVLVALGPLCLACDLMSYFAEVPAALCDVPGARERVPCDPCALGTLVRTCGEDHRWQAVTGCLDNPYDADGDGFANQRCFDERGPEPSCCGSLVDCDDSSGARFPGALADVDGDDFFDARCCSTDDDPRCTDCDDDDVYAWFGHADRDGDGHVDEACGGDDCDDQSPLRWTGYADVDGDGHTDARCCGPGSTMCDDCDDDDPLRWAGHADLDGDGRTSSGCGGDDCDDRSPLRWTGHADVDGDGHVDSRCCVEGSGSACDDCNDDDPWRWGGHADLDGDGHVDSRCGGEDCDDGCPSCHPGAEPALGEARDHDCSGQPDELETFECLEPELTVVSALEEVGESRALFVSAGLAYLATAEGLVQVDVSSPSRPEVRGRLALGDARDVTLAGDLALLATTRGLVVVGLLPDGTSPPEMVLLAGAVATGDSRAVFVSGGLAFVGSYEGLFVVDLATPSEPAVLAALGPPLLHDVRDVQVTSAAGSRSGLELAVLARATAEHPGGALVLTRFAEGWIPSPLAVIDLPGGNRLDAGCSGYLAAATEEGLSLVLGYALREGGFPLSGAEGLFVECREVPFEVVAYVARADELTAFIPWGEGGEVVASVEAPRARDVFVSAGYALVATERGLRVVRVACP